MRAQDREGNETRLFTSKVLPVDPNSNDTNELRGNLAGIANPAKYERARAALRPYALLVVDYLEDVNEEQSARVRAIDRGLIQSST